jgi:GMP synthase-like glutamine amidotransferase
MGSALWRLSTAGPVSNAAMPIHRVIVLQHAAHEHAGAIATRCRARGLAVEDLALWSGAPVPTTLPDDAALVVMGGPMGVYEQDDPRWPFLRPELALLKRCLAEDRGVLGICLGAQLLGAAAGFPVHPHRLPAPDGSLRVVREVGWGPVELDQSAPECAGLPARLTVLHWHGDTVHLPPSVTPLAWTWTCRSQAFRLGTRQYGLQFHPEVDAAMVRAWCAEDADYVCSALGEGGPELIAAAAEAGCAALRGPGDRLLGNLLERVLG